MARGGMLLLLFVAVATAKVVGGGSVVFVCQRWLSVQPRRQRRFLSL